MSQVAIAPESPGHVESGNGPIAGVRIAEMASPPAARIIFVGDSGVGKTALIHRAKNHRFDESTTPTIGAGITDMSAEVGGRHLQFQFWDTAGQEIYRNIVLIYFRNVAGAILVFSVSERQSFLNLDDWVNQLSAHADEDIGVVVCGNKIDRDDYAVDQAEAEKWANDRRFTIVFTSALTGENVEILVDHAARRFLGPRRIEPIRSGPAERGPEEKPCC
jgi:small GTP-binding protein